MDYKDYGQAFKEIRVHKKMSLADVEYVSGVSKSTLSQFENGISMISFEKLERALDAVYVTVVDYCLVINKGEPEYFISQFKKIEKLYLKHSNEKLLEIYDTNLRNGEKGTDLIGLCAKACYSALSEEEQRFVENYLLSTFDWGLYDLHVLLNVLERINLSLLNDILEKILNNEYCNYLRILPSYGEPYVWILIKSSLLFIRKKRISQARWLIRSLELFETESNFTAKIGLSYIKACYQYIFESKVQGFESIEHLLEMLKKIGACEIKDLFAFYFQKLEC